MSDLNFKVNSEDFKNVLDSFKKQLQKELNESVSQLSEMTYNKILEISGQKLHSTFHIYKDALSQRRQGIGVYIIALDSKAMWIEDGLPAGFDMKPGLLKGKSAKTGKNGRYAIVPFLQNKRPSHQTPKAQDLTSQIKKVLKQENIPFAKIEKNADGSPKIGLLHKIDIESDKPTAKASHGALEGLRIYQSQDAKGKVSRSMFTFRTVKEGSDKWIHPGLDAKLFLDQAFAWAVETWDKEILPNLMTKWAGK